VRIPLLPELLSPLPLLAAALLALNDRVLKARWPGLVTGKLSDLAGAFVFPLFVSAVLALATRWPLRRRLAIGVAATVLLLGAVKLSPAAARFTAAALDTIWTPLTGHRNAIVPDPTDLVALPLAALAYAYGISAGRRAQPEVTQKPGPAPERT
jgi:hypothetical protein